MRIAIKLKDNPKYKKDLPDISYDKFVDPPPWSMSSDMAYEKYLRDNNMQEISDYNKDSTADIELVMVDKYSKRIMRFECVYDSDNDDNFEWKEKETK